MDDLSTRVVLFTFVFGPDQSKWTSGLSWCEYTLHFGVNHFFKSVWYSGPKLPHLQYFIMHFLVCLPKVYFWSVTNSTQAAWDELRNWNISCLPDLLEDHAGQWGQADPAFPVRTQAHVEISSYEQHDLISGLKLRHYLNCMENVKSVCA